MTVVVVGSANVDEVLHVASLPRLGETVLAGRRNSARGGKGQNQAVAAARSGAPTAFVGRVGDDESGRMIMRGLREDGIDITQLQVHSAPTGRAFITVDAQGENTIVVSGGANSTFAELDALDRAAIERATVVLLQLEIPLATVQATARAARSAGARVVLNAAPMREDASSLLDDIDILIVNEVEAELLGVHDKARAINASLVVTRGSLGADISDSGGPVERVPAPSVQSVDSTGAGDTFAGALAAELHRGSNLGDAVRYAVHAAALSVQTGGAVPSIPTREQVETAWPDLLPSGQGAL